MKEIGAAVGVTTVGLYLTAMAQRGEVERVLSGTGNKGQQPYLYSLPSPAEPPIAEPEPAEAFATVS